MDREQAEAFLQKRAQKARLSGKDESRLTGKISRVKGRRRRRLRRRDSAKNGEAEKSATPFILALRCVRFCDKIGK
jgi:hypothetical protein